MKISKNLKVDNRTKTKIRLNKLQKKSCDLIINNLTIKLSRNEMIRINSLIDLALNIMDTQKEIKRN